MNPLPKYTCPVCGKGKLTPQIGDYTANLPEGERLTVRNVPMDVCDFCGEIALGEEAADQIDAAVAEYNESISPKELEYIRKSFEVTQSQISDILGLGSKTYHRWENGLQYPSRSMGYYLRVLHQFPLAFDWLRKRAWKTAPMNRLNFEALDMVYLFPSLAARGHKPEANNVEYSNTRNIALALFDID